MPTTCPFCNAAVTVAGVLPASRRVPCPRCGELVPVKGDGPSAGAPVESASTQPPASPSGWTNRQIGLAVLAFMAFMAAVALGYALKTVEWRRSHDKPEEERTPAGPTVVAPADLAGVG